MMSETIITERSFVITFFFKCFSLYNTSQVSYIFYYVILIKLLEYYNRQQRVVSL